MDFYTDWVLDAWRGTPSPDNYGARLGETEMSGNTLTLMLLAGAVAVTVAVWALTLLTRGLVDIFKHILFIWIAIALYNYVASAAATSSYVIRAAMYMYNVTGAGFLVQ